MPKQPSPHPHLLLPVCTQVVTRAAVRVPGAQPVRPAGAVGVIVRTPLDHTHTYGVRFPDGLEVSLHRHELTIRKHFQRHGLTAGSTLIEYDLQAYVIYRCVVGSRAYGLDKPGSDLDRRGMYLPPADVYWSLSGVPEQLEQPATEECYWEMKKIPGVSAEGKPQRSGVSLHASGRNGHTSGTGAACHA